MNKADIEQYYKLLAPKVTSYLVASGTPYAAACDIVQESFLKLWKMRDEVEGDEMRVSGLVHTIARNLRNDKFRHDRFMTFRDEIHDNELVTENAGPAPGDDDYLKKRLTTALAALPPLLREAFVLFQISELSIREIALQLCITESLVKVRIFRAKQKLKEILSDLATF